MERNSVKGSQPLGSNPIGRREMLEMATNRMCYNDILWFSDRCEASRATGMCEMKGF